MYEDVEADFWKEILVTMQQKNMVRPGADSLYFDGIQEAFNQFAENHPDIKSSLEMANSYATCEMEISGTIKLRLFVQSQIKGTLLQQNGTDYIKIADAKFPNNPFPEIEDFFTHRDEYLNQLEKMVGESIHSNKKQQIAQEFLKAYLQKKYPDSKWNLEIVKDGFIVDLENGNEKKQIHLDLQKVTENIFFEI